MRGRFVAYESAEGPMRSRVARWLVLLLACIPGVLHAAAPRPRTDERPLRARAPIPASIQSIDFGTRIDANNLSMVVTNIGSFAWDLTSGSAGLEYPKGSGRTAMFAGGLWVGAHVNGGGHVALPEYTQEYLPGQMVSGNSHHPSPPEYKVYQLLRQDPTHP